jgi:hypothetical protein
MMLPDADDYRMCKDALQENVRWRRDGTKEKKEAKLERGMGNIGN